MELLYLLGSILYNSILSITLSLLLPFNYLYHIITQPKSSSTTSQSSQNDEPFFLYQGTVWHERRRPVRHAFHYNVRYALLDLDTAPNTLPSSFFSNHLSAQTARQITSTSGPVHLLTIPPSVGYEQNPLSVYYCYEVDGSSKYLKKCIAEVTNTPWGERVSFVFNPDSDTVAKPLHVSPFMDMLGNWKMKANTPGDDLFLAISVQHPKLGDYFTATLKVKRVSSGVFNPSLFFWWIPQKVSLWIYWQALKLWWKKVQFVQHPKYLSPNYREDALTRDKMLQCCQTIGENSNRCLGDDRSHPNGLAADEDGGRWCIWRDAQWPWN